jgi:hypothetical protein
MSPVLSNLASSFLHALDPTHLVFWNFEDTHLSQKSLFQGHYLPNCLKLQIKSSMLVLSFACVPGTTLLTLCPKRWMLLLNRGWEQICRFPKI